MNLDWIKSSEQLPELLHVYSWGSKSSDNVLIYRKDQQYVGYLYCDHPSLEKSWVIDDYNDFEIDNTYWMPLPKNPV